MAKLKIDGISRESGAFPVGMTDLNFGFKRLITMSCREESHHVTSDVECVDKRTKSNEFFDTSIIAGCSAQAGSQAGPARVALQ